MDITALNSVFNLIIEKKNLEAALKIYEFILDENLKSFKLDNFNIPKESLMTLLNAQTKRLKQASINLREEIESHIEVFSEC